MNRKIDSQKVAEKLASKTFPKVIYLGRAYMRRALSEGLNAYRRVQDEKGKETYGDNNNSLVCLCARGLQRDRNRR